MENMTTAYEDLCSFYKQQNSKNSIQVIRTSCLLFILYTNSTSAVDTYSPFLSLRMNDMAIKHRAT